MPWPRNGFSLIELLLVLLLMGILLAVAVPLGERSVARYNLTGAARQMAADIRMHQQVAISAEDPINVYYIAFDTSRHQYKLHRSIKVMKTVNLPATVQIYTTNLANNRLQFKIQGAPSPGGGTITLRDKVAGELYYVIVASITGRVRISTEPPVGGE